MKEQNKYEMIKSVVDHNANKNRAALNLGVTRRTIDRLILGYRQKGKAFFSHKNKGRCPVTTLSKELRKKIVDLYQTKYYDCTYQLFAELLAVRENIHISVASVRNILMKDWILSPMATKRTRKQTKAALTAEKEQTNSKRAAAKLDQKLLALQEAHPRRPRSANFGEEVQIDASEYDWFGGTKTHLHAAIDDATGTLVGAYFDTQETLNGYYQVFGQILSAYGIPYKFRPDRRTVFVYQRLNTDVVEKDTYTQFAYACKQLGVHIQPTSVPQAKARVERLFGTLQGRLPVLLRLAGIKTLEQANEFLASYIDQFNAQFALQPNTIPSVFEAQPSQEKINLTLAVLCPRTVDAGCCVKYYGNYFRMLDCDGRAVPLRKGVTGMVIKALDGNLYFSDDQQVYSMDQIPLREKISAEFTTKKEPHMPKKKYIPPLSHPWRKSAFLKFKQAAQAKHPKPAA